jgi:hypothetical protein
MKKVLVSMMLGGAVAVMACASGGGGSTSTGTAVAADVTFTSVVLEGNVAEARKTPEGGYDGTLFDPTQSHVLATMSWSPKTGVATMDFVAKPEMHSTAFTFEPAKTKSGKVHASNMNLAMSSIYQKDIGEVPHDCAVSESPCTFASLWGAGPWSGSQTCSAPCPDGVLLYCTTSWNCAGQATGQTCTGGDNPTGGIYGASCNPPPPPPPPSTGDDDDDDDKGDDCDGGDFCYVE